MFLKLLASSVATDWQTRVVNAVNTILTPILIIGCSVGMIWAIVVGIKMMKADNKNERDEAKAKLINIAISLVAIAVLIGLFYALGEYLDQKGGKDFNIFDDTEKKPEGGAFINPLKNTLSLVKQCASMIIFKG